MPVIEPTTPEPSKQGQPVELPGAPAKSIVVDPGPLTTQPVLNDPGPLTTQPVRKGADPGRLETKVLTEGETREK